MQIFSDKIPNEGQRIENLFRTIFEQAPIGVYTLNKDGVIDSFNPKMTEMAGAKSSSEVIGLNALTMATYKDVGLDQQFKSGLSGKAFEVEVCYTSLTGKKETWRHYRGVPLLAPDGKTVERLLLLVEDITQRKQLEDELQKYTKHLEEEVQERTRKLASLNEQYKTVIEGSLLGIYVLQDGVYKYVNPMMVKIFGYDNEQEIIGRPWQILILDEDVPLLIKNGIDERMSGKGETTRYGFRCKKKDGTLIHVEVISNPSQFDGKPAIIGSLQDITQKKQMEEKIQKHIKELEVFEKVAIGRELKMMELKKRISELEKEKETAGKTN
jgi:PAS domain S-box-containing protein